jgi:hypothetical protein
MVGMVKPVERSETRHIGCGLMGYGLVRYGLRRAGIPTGSLPRSAAACMTLGAESRKRRNVKGNDARRGGALGERSAGAKKPRREARQDSYRRQMPKVRRAESRLGESRAGSRGIRMQGMRRGTKDILMRAQDWVERHETHPTRSRLVPYACASLSRCAICGAS